MGICFYVVVIIMHISCFNLNYSFKLLCMLTTMRQTVLLRLVIQTSEQNRQNFLPSWSLFSSICVCVYVRQMTNKWIYNMIGSEKCYVQTTQTIFDYLVTARWEATEVFWADSDLSLKRITVAATWGIAWRGTSLEAGDPSRWLQWTNQKEEAASGRVRPHGFCMWTWGRQDLLVRESGRENTGQGFCPESNVPSLLFFFFFFLLNSNH